jgi:hypothetical protein
MEYATFMWEAVRTKACADLLTWAKNQALLSDSVPNANRECGCKCSILGQLAILQVALIRTCP